MRRSLFFSRWMHGLPSLHSVRLRLAVWNITVLALMLVSTGFLLRRMVRDNLYAGVEQQLKLRSGFLREVWRMNGKAGLAQLISRRSQLSRTLPPRNPSMSLPQIYSLAGQNLLPGHAVPWDTAAFHRGVEGEMLFTNLWQPIPHTSAQSNGVEHLMILTLPLKDQQGEINGVFQSSESLAAADEQVAKVTATLLQLIPTALIIAGIGGAFLTERAIRPVRAITQAASGIEAQDLSGRLPVVGRDEFAQLARTFNAMLARLEQSFEQQKRFVADASHELRTPLTIITANTTLALSSPRTGDDYRETLQEIQWAAERTNRIVQDMFLLARSDSGELPMRREIVRVDELLARCVRDMCRATESPKAAITYAPAPKHAAPPQVLADAHHLERLFTNLIENALRHTPPGGCIQVSAAVSAARVVARVADTGEGIAPEHLAHIRERFYRVDTDRSRGKGGTGLGLAICEVIAHAHDGTMTIESEVGRGTTVTIDLPRIQITEEKFSDFLVIL